MSIATTTAIGLAAGLGAAGSIGAAAIGSSAAGHAANTQAGAEEYATQLQKQEADQALAFQKQQYGTQQAQIAPWIAAGTKALGEYQNLPSFQAPTNANSHNDPGYVFRLQQGEQALDRGAAARGDVLTGGTAKAEQRYGQDYASNEYGNVYNRALTSYGLQANKLSGLAGLGQQSAVQSAQAGQQAAGNVTNIDLGAGAQIGQDYANAAAARGSGYVGQANAWGGALGNLRNLGQNFAYMNMFNQQQPMWNAQTPNPFGSAG